MRERTTKKQQALLHYIGEFLDENNFAPSYREIMVALGYKSVSTVAVHVDGLITKGYLTKSDKSARSVRMASEPKEGPVNHMAWLQTEISARETAGALPEDLEILRKAVEILES